MVVSIKDTAKLIGIAIICCCAVFVCNMFLNFGLDLAAIHDSLTTETELIFYDALISTAKLISAISGGCLLITSVIMLIFYIKHYIDAHKKELGILKALGYSNFKIASNFWSFGASVLIGTLVGYGGSFLIMPLFYEAQNADNYLPEISITIHPILGVCLVIIPTIVFALLAVLYAAIKLRTPVLGLLRESFSTTTKIKKHRRKDDVENNKSFLKDLRKNTLCSKKSLVFFIMFASFCYAAMVQMSFGIKDYASDLFAVIMIMIGLVLAFTTLFIAITTVINSNIKTVAMMRVFGYSQYDCGKAILNGYRPLAYIGFAVGTVYQFFLLKLVVELVFKDMENIAALEFDFPAFAITLVSFIIIYEFIMFVYSKKLQKISVKEIMAE